MAMQTGTTCFDYIIAGCGGAGLFLARYISLSEQLKNKRVLLLDADGQKSNDRTWCFWSDQAPPLPHIQQKNWQELQLSDEAQLQSFNIAPLRYYFTRGIDFYRQLREELDGHPNFVFQKARITDIEDTDTGAEVRTDQGTFYGKYAFSSLPVSIPKTELTTRQHFRGWFIRSKEAAFDPEKMCLMDFRTSQQEGASFFYVLPLSAHEALVEYTVVSDNILKTEAYEEALQRYVATQLKIKDFEITHTEQGVIPMTTYHFSRQVGRHVMRIGTSGGMTKASTGFTFKNMQEDAQRIVQQLEREGQPFYPVKKKRRFRFYDALLLHMLKYYPEVTPSIFEQLFRRNQARTVLTFLDERSSLWQEALIFMKLPWKPFLRSLWQYYAVPYMRGKFNWRQAKAPYYVTTQSEET
ncbi:MAG: lycopene cyclase family protein [Cyclobacteriaceae bacterium]